MVERDWINRQADGVVTEYIVTQVSKALTRAEACGCANCIAEYPETSTYHCFGCQANGDAIDLLMKLESLDFKEAVRQLGGI